MDSLWANGTALDLVDGIIDFVLLRFRTADGLAIVSSLASPESSFTEDSSVSLLSSLSRNKKSKLDSISDLEVGLFQFSGSEYLYFAKNSKKDIFSTYCTALDLEGGIIDFVLLRFNITDGLAIVSSLASPDSSFREESSCSL